MADLSGSLRIAIVVGGAAGTLLRWALSHLPALWQVPVGTLASNVLGSLLLGGLLGFAGPRMRAEALTPWTAGVLGAATTFSTFILEVVDLWPEAPVTAGTYLVASVAAGLAAARLGRLAGARRTPPAGHVWPTR